MVSLMTVGFNAMKTTTQSEQGKVRTTLYLTPENKQGLDRIPRGQKTALMNKAIANALKELEKKENGKKFIDMITQIEPVTMDLSSVEMVQQLREGKEIPSIASQAHNE
jgi:hypothetical protein